MRVKVRKAAKADINEIWRFYALSNLPYADALSKRIGEAIGQLSHFPYSGKQLFIGFAGLEHYRALVVAPYVIFYLIGDDVLEIKRVVQSSRDTRYLITELLE